MSTYSQTAWCRNVWKPGQPSSSLSHPIMLGRMMRRKFGSKIDKEGSLDWDPTELHSSHQCQRYGFMIPFPLYSRLFCSADIWDTSLTTAMLFSWGTRQLWLVPKGGTTLTPPLVVKPPPATSRLPVLSSLHAAPPNTTAQAFLEMVLYF